MNAVTEQMRLAQNLAEAIRLILEFENGEHGEPGVIGAQAIDDATTALSEWDAHYRAWSSRIGF